MSAWSLNPGEGACLPLLRLLKVAARVTEEFILLTEHLAGAELSKTRGHGRVLLNVDREVDERLVTRGHSLASQTARLAREDALEQSVDDSRVVHHGLCGRGRGRGLRRERSDGV